MKEVIIYLIIYFIDGHIRMVTMFLIPAFMIILPSREIVAIVNYEIPMLSKPKSNHRDNLQFKVDGSLYMDKLRNPGDVANLLVFADLSTTPKSASAVGEIKLKHPRLQKDLTIKGKGAVGLQGRLVDASMEFDVLNSENQKISASFILDHIRTGDGHNVTSALEFASAVCSVLNDTQFSKFPGVY